MLSVADHQGYARIGQGNEGGNRRKYGYAKAFAKVHAGRCSSELIPNWQKIPGRVTGLKSLITTNSETAKHRSHNQLYDLSLSSTKEVASTSHVTLG